MTGMPSATILKLDLGNIQPWIISIQCTADAMGIPEAIDDPEYQPDQFTARACAALTAKIIESLPSNIASHVITPNVRGRPGQLVRQVQQQTHQATPADRYALLVEAEQINLEEYETVDAFIEAHRTIRSKMMAAQYPNINDELTTVEIIIRGLRDNPEFQTVVPVWTSDPPSQINALRARIIAVHALAQRKSSTTQIPFAGQTPATSSRASTTTRMSAQHQRQTTKFCRFHAGLGRHLPHNDTECRHPHNPMGIAYRPQALAFPQPTNLQPQNVYGRNTQSQNYQQAPYFPNTNQYDNNNSAPLNRQGYQRGHRSAFKPRTKRATANDQEIHFNVQQPFEDGNLDSASHPNISDDSGKLKQNKPRVIIDSGAHPSHTPMIGTHMKTVHQPQQTLTATNATSPITHTGYIHTKTPIGNIYTNAVTTPSIPDTLISVRELTKGRKALIFTNTQAYLISQKILAKIDLKTPIAKWDIDAYCIPEEKDSCPIHHKKSDNNNTRRLSSITAPTTTATQSQTSPATPNTNTENIQKETRNEKSNAVPQRQTTIPTKHNTYIPFQKMDKEKPDNNKKNNNRQSSTYNKLLAAMPHNIPTNHPHAPAFAWHLALNHAPLQNLKTIAKMKIFPTLTPPTLKGIRDITCSACAEGKGAQAPHHIASPRNTTPGDIISSDTLGPISPPSTQHHRHIVTFLDDASRFAIAIPIRKRSELISIIPTTLKAMARHHGRTVNTFHSDNAKEYISNTIISYLTSNGIRQTLTTPHHPQQNSRAERFNRTLMNAARAAICHSGMPLAYWNYAILDATYKYNCLPHSAHNRPPISIWDPTAPHPPFFLPFGTIGHVPDPAPKKKLQSRSRPARYLCHNSAASITVLYTDTYKTGQARISDFHPIHPAIDPTIILAAAFKARPRHHTPSNITTATPPPTSTPQAQTYPDAHLWAHAHNDELEQLETQKAIEWLPPSEIPTNAKTISLTMTYRYKRDAQGKITDRKARCSIRGDLMKPNIHYDPSRTAAYSADKATIRLIFAIAAYNRQPTRHFDIQSAFTHESYNFENPVYVRQPRKFDGSLQHPDKPIGKLKLNLYGSKPACHIYHAGLDTHLQKHQYYPTEADPCLYAKTNLKGTTLIAITIDDFLVTAPKQQYISEFEKIMRMKYKIKNLGAPTRYLGWTITRTDNGPIHLSQSTLIRKILTANKMEDANPRSSPLPRNTDFDDVSNAPPLDSKATERYQSTIGDIRYLADSTRIDIAYAASRLARHTSNPNATHQAILKHLIRYLKKTIDHGIRYDAGSDKTTTSFADADYASASDRHSISGTLHTAFGGPIIWSSRKQATVALSTCEAEYIAASSALQDLLWMRRLIAETNPSKPIPPTPLFLDNKSAIDVANHEAKTKRRKHIDIKSHHLAHHAKQHSIKIIHTPSTENLADILTKALPLQQFKYLNQKLITPHH